MLSQVVKVQRKKLTACMTCPLCNKLFRDATTVSECLHTFCRKCIYDKICDDDLDSCPVCNIDLGCAPLEKLRADHSLEDLKAKIFASIRDKTKAPAVLPSVPEAVPSSPLTGRRKERYLSSLVVNTPKIAAKSTLPRKRLKSIARKSPALRESILAEELLVKKVDACCHESLSSPETLSKIAQAKRQNSIPESSKQYKTNKDREEDSAEPCEGETELWKPLNRVVEAANKSKHSKSDIEEATVQMQLPGPAENEAQVLKSVVKEHGKKSEVNGDENNSSLSPEDSVKTRKLQGIRQQRAVVSKGLNIIPAQTIVDASSKCDGRFSPIWFSLVASDDQEGNAPLPQISPCYLRIKDGNLPVSYIKKYLVQKLGLATEAEVEISLHGQPVLSTLQLHHLVDWWLQMAPSSERIQTSVGSSAKEFVMVLSYGRKTQPP
ncbi:hypothetical protein P3X46_006233 [Hevea brasiliensis]|uniref:RING-type domain-containing protein n=2 Tax=Hevea brasiliensis TaxID=3981 RepID=A0ABQ9MPJ5_HEVBR|nr:E3 ubiquitin protein ligase DRIP2 isoform X2 [Hevea brasiliensis]XP_058001110.1 E3 ubiquitin protein ligase DRIP2 isoform X2 [Hevea brasiliensis]KAJ9182212.1 hypothetical protein P3X46_006233 [Hevea brasiliensis]